ncbi:hypothetical protein LTS01_006692 [Friedmanniomyces endolithicus]|nr:hypothetical protein LTS01_006692 [Friedmanniomyces endolithicus]
MAPAALTPESSGTSTPTTTTVSKLTEAGIKHASHNSNGQTGDLAPLDASLMTITLNNNLKTVPEFDGPEAKAQKTMTDHMVTALWTIEHGWAAPELKPYGPLSIMPSASVLHYATECFEGLKLYRGYDGRLRLFRVSRNCARMCRSASRIALPDFDPRELEKMIVALCARDGPRWLPQDRAGSFLYIRPTMIATDSALGVQRPREALFPGLRLIASSEDTIRAWPGGFGYAKVGANYGPSLVAQGEAKAKGFDQVLWLFGSDDYVTEAGASNFFVVLREKTSGKLQLITAPLEERMILEGVTRASVLELARERLTKTQEGLESVEVVEKRFNMGDLIAAYEEGRFVEAFAAGTAFFVAPVSVIHFRGRDIAVPMDGDSGVYARLIKQWLSNIMYGKQQHEWGVVVEEEMQ